MNLAITDLKLALGSVVIAPNCHGKYSICETFNDEQGNIRYNTNENTWHIVDDVLLWCHQSNMTEITSIKKPMLQFSPYRPNSYQYIQYERRNSLKSPHLSDGCYI